jgi:hypothetical protein
VTASLLRSTHATARVIPRQRAQSRLAMALGAASSLLVVVRGSSEPLVEPLASNCRFRSVRALSRAHRPVGRIVT